MTKYMLALALAAFALGCAAPTPVAVPPPGLGVLVVDAQSRPVAGASVHDVQQHWRHVELGRTDAAGRLTLTPSSESRSLTACSDEWSFADLVDVPADRVDGEVRLVLGPAAGKLAGRVVDPMGRPVPGAWLTLELLTQGTAGSYGSYGRPSWWLVADGQGRFAVSGLPAGTVPVRAVASGTAWAPCRVDAAITAGQTADVVVALHAGAELIGTVRTVAGRPVPATLHVSADGHYDMIFADAAGAFRGATLPRERVRVRVEPREVPFEPLELTVDASSGVVSPVGVVVQPK